MGRILLYCVTVFLSAFLLFQVQPVIGKFILPWFGSTPGVWTTCMLFFQVLLLGGYAYAHFVVSRLPPKRQAMLHGALLLVALLALPITPSEGLKPDGGAAPVAGILWVLLASVGFPYLLLSSTGPLLQGWFARLHPGRSPYRLYALSNVGSLLALVTYPLYVERAWSLSQQTFLWSLGFALFVWVAAACAWTLYKGGAAAPKSSGVSGVRPPAAGGVSTRSPWPDVPLWFVLSATGSALLLATTNQMCLDIAVVPFLWVAPLAIYLLSFILTFDHARWYVRPLFLALLPLGLLCAFSLLNEGVKADIAEQIVGYGLALFLTCMCCHGELARSKPAARHLTFFFLVVSLGGAAGGLLVALVAPRVFSDFWEFPLLLVASYAVVLIAVLRTRARPEATPPTAGGGAVRAVAGSATLVVVLAAAIVMFDPWTWLGDEPSGEKVELATQWFASIRQWLLLPPAILLLLVEIARHRSRRGLASWWGDFRIHTRLAVGMVGCIGLLGMVAACGWVMRKPQSRIIAQGRNFYGSLAIKEYSADSRWHDWTLRHGRIMHGYQYKRYPGWPTSYYGPETGAGLAIRSHPARWTKGRSFRIGVVGLGAGTLASYANARLNPEAKHRHQYAEDRRRVPGDVVRYYEINPMVVRWAWEHFTFLPDARRRGADVEVFEGDARLVMQRQLEDGEGQAFDVLAIDAFSSDAIPIHLLTKESLEVYWGHLKEDGALAIHVTNRFIDLKPVVVRLAKEFQKSLVHVENYEDDDHGVYSCNWLVMTNNPGILKELAGVAEELPKEGVLWTDDYSSVWDLLKLEALSSDEASSDEASGDEASGDEASGDQQAEGLWRRLLHRVTHTPKGPVKKDEPGDS